MEGFGYIYGMINRSKSNDAYKKSVQNKRKIKKESLINSGKVEYKYNSSNSNLTKAELEEIKQVIRKKIKAERKKTLSFL